MNKLRGGALFVRPLYSLLNRATALHCGKPGRRTRMFSYKPFTAIPEVPEDSPEVVWLLWVVGETLGPTSAPLKAQKPVKPVDFSLLIVCLPLRVSGALRIQFGGAARVLKVRAILRDAVGVEIFTLTSNLTELERFY